MRLLSLLFLLALCGQVVGQRVVWEKRNGWDFYDQLCSVESVNNGLFIASGFAYRYGYRMPNGNVYYGPALVKFDEQGDTLWVKSLGYYTRSATTMCKGPGNTLVMAVATELTEQGIRIFSLNYDGQVLSTFLLPDCRFRYPHYLRLLPDSTIELVGEGYPDSASNNLELYVANIFDPQQNLLRYGKRYSDHPGLNLGMYAEPTPDGKMLISSVAGSRLVAWTLDDTGGVASKQTVYQSASRNNLQNEAAVQALPDGTYVLSANIAGASSSSFYLGRYQSLGGARIWGGEKTTFGLSPHVNDDGSMVIYTSQAGDFGRLTKIDQDSVELWSVNIHSTLARFVQATAFNYLEDSSAVVVGYTSDSGPLAEDFYFSRITGVGVPYDPGHPVATKPKLPSIIPKPYPNPCTTTLRFSSLTAQARLEMYDMQGRQAMSQSIQSREVVDVSALPHGLYSYRLVSGSRVFVGRVVK